nr:CvpA family protein [Chloroflexota bacterium]
MNWVDAMIVVIIAISTFSSLRAGFLRQASALIGFIVGVYAALSYHDVAAISLHAYISDPTIAKIVAFGLIFVAVWIVSTILAELVSEILKAIGLAWADHLLGMLLGLLTGLLVVICLLLLLVRIPIPGLTESIRQSPLASLIFHELPHLRELLPSDLRIFKMI